MVMRDDCMSHLSLSLEPDVEVLLDKIVGTDHVVRLICPHTEGKPEDAWLQLDYFGNRPLTCNTVPFVGSGQFGREMVFSKMSRDGKHFVLSYNSGFALVMWDMIQQRLDAGSTPIAMVCRDDSSVEVEFAPWTQAFHNTEKRQPLNKVTWHGVFAVDPQQGLRLCYELCLIDGAYKVDLGHTVRKSTRVRWDSIASAQTRAIVAVNNHMCTQQKLYCMHLPMVDTVAATAAVDSSTRPVRLPYR